jgi:hypothetical protein
MFEVTGHELAHVAVILNKKNAGFHGKQRQGAGWVGKAWRVRRLGPLEWRTPCPLNLHSAANMEIWWIRVNISVNLPVGLNGKTDFG